MVLWNRTASCSGGTRVLVFVIKTKATAKTQWPEERRVTTPSPPLIPATPVPFPELITADDSLCGLPDLFRGTSMSKRILVFNTSGAMLYMLFCKFLFDLSYPGDRTCQ